MTAVEGEMRPAVNNAWKQVVACTKKCQTLVKDLKIGEPLSSDFGFMDIAKRFKSVFFAADSPPPTPKQNKRENINPNRALRIMMFTSCVVTVITITILFHYRGINVLVGDVTCIVYGCDCDSGLLHRYYIS